MVVTGLGGLPELVTDGDDGLVVPADDPSALAVAVGKLLDDPDLSSAMGAAGRAKMLAGHGVAEHLDAVFDVYAQADAHSSILTLGHPCHRSSWCSPGCRLPPGSTAVPFAGDETRRPGARCGCAARRRAAVPAAALGTAFRRSQTSAAMPRPRKCGPHRRASSTRPNLRGGGQHTAAAPTPGPGGNHVAMPMAPIARGPVDSPPAPRPRAPGPGQNHVAVPQAPIAVAPGTIRPDPDARTGAGSAAVVWRSRPPAVVLASTSRRPRPDGRRRTGESAIRARRRGTTPSVGPPESLRPSPRPSQHRRRRRGWRRGRFRGYEANGLERSGRFCATKLGPFSTRCLPRGARNVEDPGAGCVLPSSKNRPDAPAGHRWPGDDAGRDPRQFVTGDTPKHRQSQEPDGRSERHPRSDCYTRLRRRRAGVRGCRRRHGRPARRG